MATPASVSTERRVENLRAFMVNLARSNCFLLPETELFERKFLELCLSPTPDHPTYAAMIFTAITELNEEGGSSKEVISEFIKSKHNGLPFAHTSLLSHHLAKLVGKGEIIRDYNNCYLFPREKTSASSDDEEKQVKKKLRSPDSGNRRNCQCLIEGKDQVDQDRTAEAITPLAGEENDRIFQCEEHQVENGVNLSEEQALMTGVKTCPEGEANGATLQSEKLEAAIRDQSLEAQDLTTEAEVFAEIDECTASLRSEQLEDQDMQNCESLNDEKQKQKLTDVQCHEEDMQVEYLGLVHGDFGNFIQGPTDQTQEKSVMIDREDNENIVFQGEVESFDKVRQTEDKEGRVSLEQETEKAGAKSQLKDQHLSASRARVQTLQDNPYEAMRKPDAQPSKVTEALRRLREQQIEACHDIVALKKMLKRCTKNQEQNATVSAMGSSFGIQINVASFASLPLSKESCTQLWKLVHKIQGQLFEIISSYDNAEVPYESSGREAESVGKGPATGGYKKAKSPCKRNESRAFCPPKQLEHKKRDSASQQKPLIEKTSPKRPRVGEPFRKHKQAKFCDRHHPSILVCGDGPFDSSVRERAETTRESAKAITTRLEKEYQPEKPNLTATAVLALPVPEPDTIEKLQPKAKRPDQMALQIEATNTTITEPSTSPSKCVVEDGHNQFEWKNAWEQPKGKANLDASMMDTRFLDDPNSNEKQLQKQGWEKDNTLGTGTSSDEQIFEPEPQLSGQLISQAIDQNKKMEVDCHESSQPCLIINKPEAKPSPKRYKRRGRPAKRKGNTEASENAKLLNADGNNLQKQGPLRAQKLGPRPDAPSTTLPSTQTLTGLGLPLVSTPGRITRARAAAAAAVDASESSFSP